MDDSTTTTPAAFQLYENTGLQLYIDASNGDAAPALMLADGGGSVKIGDTAAAVALAEAITRFAQPTGPSLSPEADEPLKVPAYLDDLANPVDTAEAQRRAAAYPCGVPGCNGASHEAPDDPAEFIHVLERVEAGRLRVEVYVPAERDGVHADVWIADTSGDIADENGLRALAAELRSYATIIERQTVALELHSAALKRSQS